jgi:hypothetical protein
MIIMTMALLLTNYSGAYANGNTNPNTNTNKKDWYDCVYLCIENKKSGNHKYKFDCYKFNTIEQADNYFMNYKQTTPHISKHTVIFMCKWIPNICHSYFLNKSLKNIFWKGAILK